MVARAHISSVCKMVNSELPWFKSYLVRALSSGPVPKHVVLSFDGNRRWAARHGHEVYEGNLCGLKACIGAIKFFKALGTLELTTFLMSTANLDRPNDQVCILFKTLSVAIDAFVSELKDTRICVVGNTNLLPEELQSKIRQTQRQPQDAHAGNTLFTLYLAIAYSSREIVATNLSQLVARDDEGNVVTVDLLDRRICTGRHKVDLLIRTSGETRLSDLCLWEVIIIWQLHNYNFLLLLY